MQMEENTPTPQETSENQRKVEEIPEVHAQTAVSRVTKAKNPQKVAAGKKGAAIRKQKQEAMRSQLQEAKNQLYRSYHTKEENDYTEEKAAEPACHTATNNIWMYAFLTLVLLGGGVAYLQIQTNNKAANSNITSTVKEPTHAQGQKEPILKKQDPFIMQ